MARICLYGDLQRFGRRIDLRVKTGAEAIRALATQLPAFRQKLSDGWYQVRIAGKDTGERELSARLHESLPDGAVIHLVPRTAGAKNGGVFQIVLGAVAIAASFFTAGASLAMWGAALSATTLSATTVLFSLGASMILGGVAQMLAPKPKTPRMQTTDNGKQNTYFSSLDNMVAQGNVLPVLYGEMRVGSRVISQEISTADEGGGGQVVVIGR
ncbi:TPA: tail assembly protein [Escherichia coli]|nr:tail assembly protein [Escherichia coli]HAI2688124.1 tail assembly protein [Escherichia coli]HAU7852465.1 tail assembly protein [Escherichia coli]